MLPGGCQPKAPAPSTFASAASPTASSPKAWWSARGGRPYGLHYRVACTCAPTARATWQGGAGQPVEALRGCVDIDISATPFSNTLPIRRLGLAQGEASEFLAAYVAVPALVPEPVWQRYTCLEARRLYRYEGLFRSYVGELGVTRTASSSTTPPRSAACLDHAAHLYRGCQFDATWLPA